MIVTNELCTGNVHYYIYIACYMLLAHATLSASILTAPVENERLLYPITWVTVYLPLPIIIIWTLAKSRYFTRRLSNYPIPSSPGCAWTSSIVWIPFIWVSYPILSIRLQKVCEPWWIVWTLVFWPSPSSASRKYENWLNCFEKLSHTILSTNMYVNLINY